MSFERQAAIELEFAQRLDVRDAYPFRIERTRPMKVDWEPMIRPFLADIARKESRAVISARFQNELTEMIVSAARNIGEQNLVFGGGCFQNRYLTDGAVARLRWESLRRIGINEFRLTTAASRLVRTSQ